MTSIVAQSHPSVSAETIRSYARGLIERASAPSDDATPSQSQSQSQSQAKQEIEVQVQRVLRDLVRARSASIYTKLADSVKDALGPNASGKIGATDLIAAQVSLRDIELAGVTPRALAEFRVVRTLDAWQQIGIKSAADLFNRVGKPRELRSWMASADWTALAKALTSSAPGRRAWWSPEIWLSMAGALEPGDLRAMGVNLDAWLAADADLLKSARALAATWLTKYPLKKWQKSGVLSPAAHAKLVALPTYFL